MLSRAEMTQRSSERAGSNMAEWADVAGEPGEMLPSLLWPEGDMSALREGGGGGSWAPPVSWYPSFSKLFFFVNDAWVN
jgi:hypothetical protein